MLILIAALVGMVETADAFYDPGLQRWINRDPLGDIASLPVITATIFPGFETQGPGNLSPGGIFNAWLEVNRNLYGGLGNKSVNLVDPTGLCGWMDMRALPNYNGPSTLTPSEIPIEDVANFGGGFGDGLSLNLTKLGRNLTGIDSVDTGSGAYKAGGWASFAVGVGRLAYAGLAKAGSVLAKTPEAASAFREALKGAFRGGAGKNWRPPNLAGKTAEALRGSAGRTNPGMNAYGGGVAGVGYSNTCEAEGSK